MVRDHDPLAPAYEYIFRPFITLRNGRRIYARSYGKSAFRIRVKVRPFES